MPYVLANECERLFLVCERWICGFQLLDVLVSFFQHYAGVIELTFVLQFNEVQAGGQVVGQCCFGGAAGGGQRCFGDQATIQAMHVEKPVTGGIIGQVEGQAAGGRVWIEGKGEAIVCS